ncbi:MAG: TonB-dependent receptor [Acidobacteria bacterium]|nr:TonB-dependent receptor [Acidobacteriota bacterium]
MKTPYRYLLIPILVISVVLPLHMAVLQAQLTRGFVSGTVTDQSGAFVPGAEVSITNAGTNIRQQTLTNEEGIYRFVAVEPGTYSVEFKMSGFQAHRVNDIVVGPAREVVINHSLIIGSESTMVEVVGTPPGVELAKATATIERTLNAKAVSELPILSNGGTFRDVTRLALLAPTAVRAPASNEFAVNGQRARNTNFLIDGTDNNDLSVTLQNARVVPEAVAEFQVQTESFSAEFGRNSGAQISIITKSGSNDLHGGVFDFYRGNALEPLSLLNKRAGLTKSPRFTHNQAGGYIGGPVMKDRTFFFGLIEANRRREAPDARNSTSANIPTPAGLAALSTVPLASGQSQQSRQAVLGSLGFLSDVHKQVSRYDNIRDVTINNVPIQVGTIRIPLANPHDFWYALGRADHRFSDADSVNYRYQLDKRNQPDVVSNLRFGNRFSGAQAIAAHNHAASYIHNFSSRLINEFRFAYIGRDLDFPENDPKSSTVNIGSDFVIGGLANFPQGRVSHVFQWQDIATYQRGRQSFKMGLDIRYNKLFNRADFDSKGTWTFASLADFVNNRGQQLTQALNTASFDARQTNQYYFFQDDIRLTRNLNLNLGMRYEYSGVPFGFFGASSPEVAAVGVPLPVKPDKNNWAPRIGFAYSPGRKEGWMGTLLGEGQTVVRGGVGMAYDVLFYNILTVNASNFPRVVVNTFNQADILDRFPTLLQRQPVVTLNPLATFTNAPSELQNPTTHFWSLSVQRQLHSNYILEIGYTGNRSYHQIRQGQGNPPVLTPQQAAAVVATGNPNAFNLTPQQRRVNPNWGARTLIESSALAEYHAMILRLDKRLSRGLVLGANYTWSANFSDNDESLAVNDITLSSPQTPQDFFNFKNEWSRSVFDRPHRFVVHYQYDIPWFGAAGANTPFLRHVFSGWQISGYTEAQSGQPFTIRTGVDSVGTTAGGANPPGRPNYNPGGAFTPDPVTGNLRTFRTSISGGGIVVAPLSAQGVPLVNSMSGGGNLGRNTFRGPAYHNWNFSLAKTVAVAERWKIQVRSDFINLWNHDNFQNPESRMNNSAFGGNTADLLTDVRQVLLSAKITF